METGSDSVHIICKRKSVLKVKVTTVLQIDRKVQSNDIKRYWVTIMTPGQQIQSLQI